MRWRFLLMTALCCLVSANLRAAQLAIIIDDVGYNEALGRRATDLAGAFTLAVLPLTPHTRDLAERGFRQGKEIMLHAPMANLRHMPLGNGGLLSGMTHEDFIATLRRNIADIPHLRGVNNHMGSQLTQEPASMGWLMHELAQQNLYFIDSRTSAASQALRIARAYRIPSMKRDIFLDNTRTRDSIQQQLLKAIQLAKHRGVAIAIGHPYPETLAVLERIQPVLIQQNVQLVPVSRLLALRYHPQGDRGTCYAPPQTLWPNPAVTPESFSVRGLTHNLAPFGYHD